MKLSSFKAGMRKKQDKREKDKGVKGEGRCERQGYTQHTDLTMASINSEEDGKCCPVCP